MNNLSQQFLKICALSVHCNLAALIQVGLKYKPGVWRNCINRSEGLLFQDLQCDLMAGDSWLTEWTTFTSSTPGGVSWVSSWHSTAASSELMSGRGVDWQTAAMLLLRTPAPCLTYAYHINTPAHCGERCEETLHYRYCVTLNYQQRHVQICRQLWLIITPAAVQWYGKQHKYTIDVATKFSGKLCKFAVHTLLMTTLLAFRFGFIKILTSDDSQSNC